MNPFSFARVHTLLSTCLLGAGLLASASFSCQAAVRLYETNLVVVRVGNGSQVLANTGNSVFLDQYTASGVYLNGVAIPDTGSNAAVLSGTAFVEGYLARSPDGQYLSLAVYGTNLNCRINVSTAAATAVPRVVGLVDCDGNFSSAVSVTDNFSSTGWRSAVTDGTNSFWGTGGANGIAYLGYGPRATIENAKANCRVLQIFNGDLYMSSGSTAADGFTGIYRFNGLPRSAVPLPSPTVFTNTFTGLNGVTDFAVSPSGTRIYFADDRALSDTAGGIQRWDYNSAQSVWVNTYHLTNGLPGVGVSHLTVDWSGASPVLFAVSSGTSANSLMRVTDQGAASPFAILSTAATNQVLRGVKFGLASPSEFARTAVAIRQSAPAYVYAGGTPQLCPAFVDYNTASNVDMTLAPGLLRMSLDPTIATIAPDGSVLGHKAGSCALRAVYAGLTNDMLLTVVLAPGFQSAVLTHRYSFDGAPGTSAVTDSVGGSHGEVVNLKQGSTSDTFTGSGELKLTGRNNSVPFSAYVNLPNGLVSGYQSVTLEGWITWNGLASATWQRVFDFGRNSAVNSQGAFVEDAFAPTGINYMMLTPRSGNSGNRARFAMGPPGQELPVLEGPSQMAIGVETHFAVVYDSASGAVRLYLNGQLASVGPTVYPLSQIEDRNVWLGRSQWIADAFFDGLYNEFRIYEGALLPEQIAASYASGPNSFTGSTRVPANDSFANALLISGQSINTNGSTISATKEPGEPDHAGETGGRSVWWKWKPVTYGPVRVDTAGSSFRTLLGVYTGSSVSNLTKVASAAGNGVGASSFLSFVGVPGNTYYVAIDGTNPISGGVSLHLEQPPTTAPQILTQPVPSSVGESYPATFQVQATGLPDISYQWLTDGAPISDATNSLLSLTNVQGSDAGDYQVVLSNALDITISSNAALSVLPSYTFTRLAGQDRTAGSADGVGNSARFNGPHGIALDELGNLYVTEELNHTIRKITQAGAVTTIAGLALTTGTNDGLGTVARFNRPLGVAALTSSNLYVADSGNHCIRKLSLNGTTWTVSTLAGRGGISGSADGVGGNALFKSVRDIALDVAGNLFVADQDNHVIRKVTPAGAVTTIAGVAGQIGAFDGIGAAARFYAPGGIKLDPFGNLYVCDLFNRTLRKLTPVGTNWSVSTVAGLAPINGAADGTGSRARFSSPSMLAFDPSGNLLMTDFLASSIRLITPGGVVSTVAGSPGVNGSRLGRGPVALFGKPRGIAADAQGNIFVPDFDNQTILVGYASAAPMKPSIQVPPVSQVVLAGSNATFSVIGAGTPPLSFSWRRFDTNFLGAGLSTLQITNAQVVNAAYYRAVITNVAGGVTSAPVILGIRNAPFYFQPQEASLLGDGFHTVLSGLAGQGAIVLSGSTNLTSWTPILTNPAAFGSLLFIDPAATNLPTRFYRADLLP